MKTVVCGGLTFENTPVEQRERVAFSAARLPEALASLRETLGLDEVVILSTCNRVEYFGVTTAPERCASQWPEFLRSFHALDADFNVETFHQQGREGVEHLFQVATGLKSMVLGETEIFGQVKTAYETAVQAGSTGKWLNRLFQTSFAAAKDARTNTQITRGSVSVGSVAVELAEKIFGALHGRTVMVLGAGEISERTARFLHGRGVHSVLVANRTYDHALQLAGELQGRAVRWDEWESEVVGVDIVISSTSAPHYVVTKERLEPVLPLRKGRPLFLIDLAVPRDIEPEIHQLDGVFRYDIDDLHMITKQHLAERSLEVERSLLILKPHVDKFEAWLEQQREGAELRWISTTQRTTSA
jgi:glutamyl-tRNA reductase